MSSWGQPISSQSRLKYTDLFCKISKSGYGTNFQKFLMAYLYSKYLKKPLYLCDTTNNISNTFHLILDTFQPILNVKYTNKRGLTIFEDKIVELNAFLCKLSDDEICREARAAFRYSDKIQAIINSILSEATFPAFDIGVHIRTGDKITTGEMKAIYLETYVEAIKEAQISLGKSSMSIYVMTDNSSIVRQLKALSDSSWSLYCLEPPIKSESGHDQATYNMRSVNDKMASYHHFLTELYILQRCSYIVCTYSSNIGRFLFMTKEPGTQIKSLDYPVFTILHDMSIFLSNSTSTPSH